MWSKPYINIRILMRILKFVDFLIINLFCLHFQDLLLLEEQEGSVNFKFGILYMRPHQLTDDEMLSNGEITFIIRTSLYTYYNN